MQTKTERTIPGLGTVSFNMQRAFLTIAEDLRQIYSFDADGRFLVGFLDGINYRRGLDNTVLQTRPATPQMPKHSHHLSEQEGGDLLASIIRRVARIRPHIGADAPPGLPEWLDRILAWDVERLHAERAAFQRIYRPISILPPDQYMALVLQAAEGCSWNRCTFCTFYHDRRFRIKPPDEFRQHARQVRQLLGGSLALRKSVFLADANALIIPQPRLRELLRIVHEEFPIGAAQSADGAALNGIYSFLDIFGAEKKTLADYRELRDYGVRRIYIGLETGDDTLFALLNKPGSPGECIEAVHIIKEAGIDVGVIVLAGAGGDLFAAQHVEHSLAALGAMGLGSGDIIYLSPMHMSGDEEYVQQMRERGARALSHAETLAQVRLFKDAWKARGSGRPRVTLYDIAGFIY
jgi:hypothetical protein